MTTPIPTRQIRAGLAPSCQLQGQRTARRQVPDSLTHLSLFYEYRNSLVHELREPGRGMEFADDDLEPYYHSMIDLQAPIQRTVELVYPLGFYFRLTEDVIRNVRKHLSDQRIDPYTCYRFGTSWVSALNGSEEASD